MGTMGMAKTEHSTTDIGSEEQKRWNDWFNDHVSRARPIWRGRSFTKLDVGQRHNFVPDPIWKRDKEFRSAHWYSNNRPSTRYQLLADMAESRNEY